MQLHKSCVLLFVCILAATPSIHAGVPTYAQFQLQARANFSGAFNLPSGAFFSGITVQVNDTGDVAFNLGVLPPPNDLAKGVWYGGHGNGSIVHITPNDSFISNVSLNNTGRIAFEQVFSSQNGLWVYNIQTMTAARETTMPLGASGWGSPTINNAYQIGYRANFAGSGQAFYSYDPGPPAAAVLHVAEAGPLPESPYSFLFTPSFNHARQIAGKARLGMAGQVGESQPDQIRIFNADGTSILVAEDDDSNPTSPYDRFDNSVALTDDGRVAFISTLFGGGRGVYLSDGTTTIEIANTNVDPSNNIEFFAPAVNESGWVTFRAFENTGLRAIWVGDGTTLHRVVREHDLVPSDLGTARIDQHDTSPVFGGGMTINECGDIAFNAGLAPPDNNQVEWGSGVYVALASRDRKGDLECDCRVTLDDVEPFVLALLDPAAYAAVHPTCNILNGDMNADGVLDGQDISGFKDELLP